ncbi:hypothetical protein C0995_012219 [Termitomyces sp. Mi166|nr:hypothetical protein C0995_012219 [Termitomyces sp. Mi166\
MALTDVLGSHICRIKSLTLRSSHSGLTDSQRNVYQQMISELLALLAKPAPMLEHLDLHTQHPEASLPIEKITEHSPLKCLKLLGLHMVWELSALVNLRTLTLSFLPEHAKPTVEQLLSLLSQTPLLETHSFLGFAFDQAKNVREIRLTLLIPNSAQSEASTIAMVKDLARKVSCIEGSIVAMDMMRRNVGCWKSLNDQIPVPKGEPAIDTYFIGPTHMENQFKYTFLQSLDLSGLLLLESGPYIPVDAWSLFGDLPILEDLFLSYSSNLIHLLEVFGRGMVATPDVLHPSFPSLKSLTIYRSTLGRLDREMESILWRLTACFRRRMEAGLRLELLILRRCDEVDEEELHFLQDVVKEVQVDWDGSVNEHNQFEPETDEMD